MSRVVVVGGGAAGMLAAITSAGERVPTVLLEKTGRLGLKLQISGGGRCNVTNDQDEVRALIKMLPGNGAFLANALRAYPKRRLLELLDRRGVPTKVEPPYGKVFPVSDRSTDVLQALSDEMRDLGVEVVLNAAVRALQQDGGRVAGVETADGRIFPAGAVIVCTGGKTLPRSGSTGDGYDLARAAGHTVTELFPSLVPLRVDGVTELAGVALRDVEGTVLVEGRVADRPFRGDVLFRHSGLTGPVILQLSRAAADGLRRGRSVEVRLDLQPGRDDAAVDADLRARMSARPGAQIGTVLHEYLPKAAVPHLLRAAELDASARVAEFPRESRRRLVRTLKAWRFPVAGWHSFDVAEVTAGGVDVREVDPKTFESKRVAGLYWAGEVLDVDGYVGGYNLQAAWSSGYLAGLAAARRVRGGTASGGGP